jgi:hypothetical protein
MTQFKRKQESDIDPDDIWGDDAFGTLESYGTFLTNALVADLGNFVLNVNGAWGSGKTFFVNRWAEQLRQAGHPVVEFNAWENDSAEDPLAPLIAALIDSQKEILPPTMGDKLKQGCGKYIMAGGGFIVRAGLKQLVGEKGIDSVNEMLSSDSENELIKLAGQHVEEQLEKQKAARGIAEQLKGFVAAIEAHADLKPPIFIFIDELDRCRPTFAIELLERVKHLFHVDGIKFIISTDSTQLVHSIQGVYGANFDSATYLQRFFDETFNLPDPNSEQFVKLLFKDLRETHPNLGDLWINHITPERTFTDLANGFGLTLRQQAQAFHRIHFIASNIQPTDHKAFNFLYVGALVMLRLCNDPRCKSLIRENKPDTQIRLTSRADTFRQLSGDYRISNTYLGYLNRCMQLADGDHKHAMKMANDYADQNESRSARYERNEEVAVTGWILGRCVDDFPEFQKYPQLVELTATLS